MKYYLRARKATGPDLIYEIGSYSSKEEADKAAEAGRQSGKWESVNVTTVPLQTSGPKPRRRAGGRDTRRR